MKSVGGNKPLRSRGFLSQPGGQVKTADMSQATSQDDKKHHLSRGARHVSVSKDGKPEDLQPRPHVKPYTLEDE